VQLATGNWQLATDYCTDVFVVFDLVFTVLEVPVGVGAVEDVGVVTRP